MKFETCIYALHIFYILLQFVIVFGICISKCRKSPKTPKVSKEKEGKKARVWDLSGSSKDIASLERTKEGDNENAIREFVVPDRTVSMNII